jgi:hypothetical protein
MPQIRIGFLVIAALLSLIGAAMWPAADVEAQMCHPMMTCFVSEGVGDMLLGGPAPSGVTAAPTFFHSSCLLCLDGDGEGGVCHEGCDPIQDEEDENSIAYRKAVDAFEAGDVNGALGLIPVLGPQLAWNKARSSIQLIGCDGISVLGSLPVALDVVAANGPLSVLVLPLS